MAVKTSTFYIGERVKLKTGTKPIEVNDFHSLPYYFDVGDIGEVIAVNSPRIYKKRGFSDYQTVVQFKKEGVKYPLNVRVETSNLERVKETEND